MGNGSVSKWRWASGAVAALTLFCAAPATAARNVLLILGNDMGVDVSSFYPTPVRQVTDPPAPPLPNLARLAKQGVLFRNAWASAECSPTRATLFTGRYGFRTGIGAYVKSGRPQLSKSEVGMPEVMRASYGNDYYMAHVGKWHLSILGAQEPLLHGWPHYAGPATPLTNMPNYFRWQKNINGSTSQSTTYATTDQVNEALSAIGSAKRQNRPYLIWLAFSAPHAPYHQPPGSLHGGDTAGAGTDPRALYAKMLEAMDREIGRLLKQVDLANTTVIFMGDNGTPESVVAAPYDKRAKSTIYQGGVHVPLLIAGAGVSDPGRISSALANSVDIFPTMLELAGADWRQHVGAKMDGVSLMPVLRGKPGTRKWLYAERFITAYDDRPQRAVRDSRYKLIVQQGTRQLYDLAADPRETRNLLDRTLSSVEQQAHDELQQRMDDLLATR